MAKKQKQRATRAVHIDGQTIRVARESDLSPSIIKLMVEQQAAQAELIGDEYHLRGGYGSVPQNRALAAAFRAKGLIHTARAKSSNALGDIAKDGEAPGDSLLNAASTAA